MNTPQSPEKNSSKLSILRNPYVIATITGLIGFMVYRMSAVTNGYNQSLSTKKTLHTEVQTSEANTRTKVLDLHTLVQEFDEEERQAAIALLRTITRDTTVEPGDPQKSVLQDLSAKQQGVALALLAQLATHSSDSDESSGPSRTIRSSTPISNGWVSRQLFHRLADHAAITQGYPEDFIVDRPPTKREIMKSKKANY